MSKDIEQIYGFENAEIASNDYARYEKEKKIFSGFSFVRKGSVFLTSVAFQSVSISFLKWKFLAQKLFMSLFFISRHFRCLVGFSLPLFNHLKPQGPEKKYMSETFETHSGLDLLSDGVCILRGTIIYRRIQWFRYQAPRIPCRNGSITFATVVAKDSTHYKVKSTRGKYRKTSKKEEN